MPIQAVRSADLQPAARQRSRVAPHSPERMAVDARKYLGPKAAPAELTPEQQLTAALQAYAQDNALKNQGTRQEKKSKDALNKLMVQFDRTEFRDHVEVEGALVPFSATIAESEASVVDPAAVLNLVGGDIEAFLKLVTVTATALEATHGKNAVIKCSKTVIKPADLSVKKVKE